MDFGPQYSKDPPFRARMRFHQSWYRAQVLGVGYGVGPNRKSKTKYGNMLSASDGNRGLNFLTPHIFQVAQRRLAARGGGVEEFRLLNNMLSSQPMCFNLFGPLVDNVGLATRLSCVFLPGEVNDVLKVSLEFAPEPLSDYLNDRTAFDACVEYEHTDGSQAFIGIETKLSGPFTQKQYANPRYLEWTRRMDSPWPGASLPFLQTTRFNQLWRNHLLAVAYKGASPLGFSTGRLMLVYHPADTEMEATLQAYRALLKPEDATFLALPLDRLVEKWRRSDLSEKEARWLADFRLRYLDLSASQADYEAYNASVRHPPLPS
jgi:hypothetical protein